MNNKDMPVDLLPVLAKIEHQGSLGLSCWFEVVYYCDTRYKWMPYSGSKTFNDGEKVVEWEYVNSINLPNKIK